MLWHRRGVVASALVGTLAASATAQEQIVASLPWLHGQTAGPNGTNYEPPQDDRDLWVVEDFSLTTGTYLTRFESWGTIFPTPLFVFDVTVRIYDGLPTTGNLLMSSIPGTGRIVAAGFENRIVADFQRQYLPPGSYYVVWNASTRTSSSQIAIFWAQAGAHAVGGGLPDNAWQWNPGGGWAYPGNIRAVPAQLGGGGQIGVNFELFGSSCYPNCDGSTAAPSLNVADFVCFQNRFAAGHPYANCDRSTAAPTLNVRRLHLLHELDRRGLQLAPLAGIEHHAQRQGHAPVQAQVVVRFHIEHVAVQDRELPVERPR
jgi:hypothetical protein